MTRILVTGSSDGIGRQTALELVRGGHEVVLHARNDQRARDARDAVPGAAAVVVGDLASLAQTRALAEAANEAGPYDAVIHNAGVGGGGDRVVTVDGFEHIFAVNVLATYVLTCLMPVPARLVYLTSGLQAQGEVAVVVLGVGGARAAHAPGSEPTGDVGRDRSRDRSRPCPRHDSSMSCLHRCRGPLSYLHLHRGVEPSIEGFPGS